MTFLPSSRQWPFLCFHFFVTFYKSDFEQTERKNKMSNWRHGIVFCNKIILKYFFLLVKKKIFDKRQTQFWLTLWVVTWIHLRLDAIKRPWMCKWTLTYNRRKKQFIKKNKDGLLTLLNVTVWWHARIFLVAVEYGF